MVNCRKLAAAGALFLALSAPALADAANETRTVSLSRFIRSSATYRGIQPPPTTVDPMTFISLRGGLVINPRGGLLLGADVSIPSISVGDAWHARVDGDVFLENSGGSRNAVSLIFNLLNYNPNGLGTTNIYYGGGIGFLFGGGAAFNAKLVLGAPVTNRFAVEANLHFIEDSTGIALVGRLTL